MELILRPCEQMSEQRYRLPKQYYPPSLAQPLPESYNLHYVFEIQAASSYREVICCWVLDLIFPLNASLSTKARR